MLCQSPITHLDSSQDRKKLYQFLDFCRQKAIAANHTKIASIALEIASVDPLVALCKWVDSSQLHFYFENRDQRRAIAAIDAAISLKLDGSQRFSKAHKFVQACLNQLISSSPATFPWTTPHFFASFTFFDQHLEPDPPFPTATIFLPRWQVSRWQDHNVAVVNLVVEPESNVESLAEKTCQEFQQISSVQYNFFRLPSGLSNLLNSWEIIDTHNFQSAVISALDSIEKHYFKKLVLAHTIDVISHLPFQWGHSLHNLRQIHPDCYVFSAGNGKGQNFIGASPERLLSIQNRQLVTDALAGSAPRGRSLTEDAKFAQQLLRSRKERWEHRVVVDFITQQLVNLGLNPQYTDTPGLVKLSNIQHLHTPIQATLPAHLHPLDILAELHPTPAVAGMPRTIACEQIRQHEPFGRSLYAAPLGWIDTQGNAEFIVGIRSALIEGHRARLYAGAGIVAGSNPEREQAEVQLKLQALLRALV